MSEIKLTADSGGGTTSIKAPSSTTSNADVVLKLPVADGSANEVLKTDGNGQLSFGSDISDLVNDTSPQLGGDLATNSNNISFADNDRARFGNSNDLDIYHDGTDNNIYDAGSGSLRISKVTGAIKLRVNNSENAVVCNQNGSVELYYDNSKKLETNSTGVHVTGMVTCTTEFRCDDNEKFVAGTGQDLQIYHNGTNSIIDSNTGNLEITSDAFYVNNAANNEVQIKATGNAGVELYHNNALRLDTTTGGADIRSSGSAVEMKLRTSGGTTRGWVYANDANQVGLLDEGGNWAIMHYNDNYTQFRVSNAIKARIDGDGLKFGTDTAAANALNDYETGTFTPTNGTIGLQSDYTYGFYQKVGDWVSVQLGVRFSSNSSSVNIYIDGLPFTPTSDQYGQYANSFAIGYATGNHIQFAIANGSGRIYLYTKNAGNQQSTHFDNDYVRLFGTYKVA